MAVVNSTPKRDNKQASRSKLGPSPLEGLISEIAEILSALPDRTRCLLLVRGAIADKMAQIDDAQDYLNGR
jgi:hypothetical protein